MTSATRTRQQKGLGVANTQTRYARKGDLGPAEMTSEDVALEQHAGILVRVRYLSTSEVIALSFLPDITGLAEQMAEEGGKPSRKDKPLGEFLAEQLETKQRVAHVAIADPDKGEDPERCSDCTKLAKGHEVRHRPSLFSLAECGGLTAQELNLVETTALKRQGAGFLRPFSEATPPENSEPSADSGS